MDPGLNVKGYKFVKAVGGGGFGLTYLYRNEAKPTELACVKQIKHDALVSKLIIEGGMDGPVAEQKADELIQKEVTIHQILKAEQDKRKNQIWNLPMLHYSWIDPNSKKDKLFLMEFCSKGDLAKKIQEYQSKGTKFPENELLRIAYGTLNGLKVLHDQKIVHRDLCAKNVMFDDFEVPKLIDFGSGRVITEKNIPTTLLMAHPLFFPPESEDPTYKYTDSTLLAVDIWEMGVLLYEMMDSPISQGKI